VLQQLREPFADAGAYRYVVFDHDSKFNWDVVEFPKATGLTPRRTRIQAPWQNGIAERWVGSCRRELLDHVSAFNEVHLRRLIAEYVRYYHEDRVHDSLDKDPPTPRQTEPKPLAATVISRPRVGGLHHRYSWREAA
jgi:putative transposase